MKISWESNFFQSPEWTMQPRLHPAFYGPSDSRTCEQKSPPETPDKADSSKTHERPLLAVYSPGFAEINYIIKYSYFITWCCVATNKSMIIDENDFVSQTKGIHQTSSLARLWRFALRWTRGTIPEWTSTIRKWSTATNGHRISEKEKEIHWKMTGLFQAQKSLSYQ